MAASVSTVCPDLVTAYTEPPAGSAMGSQGLPSCCHSLAVARLRALACAAAQHTLQRPQDRLPLQGHAHGVPVHLRRGARCRDVGQSVSSHQRMEHAVTLDCCQRQSEQGCVPLLACKLTRSSLCRPSSLHRLLLRRETSCLLSVLSFKLNKSNESSPKAKLAGSLLRR
jgi:hypothetical protein